jgi:hypothetical protein
MHKCSVADPDPGSGIGFFFDSGIRDGRKSASRSGMINPDHIFFELRNHFFGFFGVKLLILWRGSGIRDGVSSDPGFWIRDGKNSDPGSGINIPDPPHCINAYHCTILLRFFCLRYPTELKKLIVTTVRTEENLKLLGDSKNETNYLKHKLWLSIVDSVNRVRFLLLFFDFVREYVTCSVPDSDPDADADADPAIFVIDLQNASKKQIF